MLRRMSSGTNIIDAAVRFARRNPELLACARDGASSTGLSVDELLTKAIARMRAMSRQRELRDRCSGGSGEASTVVS